MDNGVSYNETDHKSCTPLHYAFKKFGKNKKSQRDPIEVVSNMLAISDLKINVADKYKKTPLHYACECDAVMCAIYLLQRGAKLKCKDIYGNTPLGVALINNHWNLAIILI